MDAARLGRIAVFAGAPVSLLVGLWAGLVRLGWGLHPLRSEIPDLHGPLMVGGFLGTLITLERAVALRRLPFYAPPALTALGGLGLVLGLPTLFPAVSFLLGSLGLVAVLAHVMRRQTQLATATMALGALAWTAGNLLWLAGRPIERLVLWWGGFLVLTIAGERLELSRFLGSTRWKRLGFLLATGLVSGGLLLGLARPGAGARLAGAGFLAIGVWMLRYDMAWKTRGQGGLQRYVAGCLLSGYVWLCVSGLLAIVQGEPRPGPAYDALLHTLFLGFVFALIFGHAPIVFPAVMQVSIRFRPAFYSHLLLLHVSLAVRLAGDLGGWGAGRRWGGLLNAAAVLLFLANTARSIGRGGADARGG